MMTKKFRRNVIISMLLLLTMGIIVALASNSKNDISPTLLLILGILGFIEILLIIRVYFMWLELRLRTMENIDDIAECLTEIREYLKEKKEETTSKKEPEKHS